MLATVTYNGHRSFIVQQVINLNEHVQQVLIMSNTTISQHEEQYRSQPMIRGI